MVSLPVVRRLDRLARWGVIGAVVTFVGLVAIWMLAVPLFWPFDENGHVAYGMALMHGRLPEAGERLRIAFPGLGQQGRHLLVGNHPPLYYTISGPLEWLGKRSGHPLDFLLLTRAVNAAMTAVNVVLVARLASLVVPRGTPKVRASLVVVAAGLTATIPSLVGASGSIYNDSLALVLATTALLLLARAVRTGMTTRSVLLLALVAMLGMLTRIAFAPVFATVAGGVLLLTLWPGLRRRRPARRDLGVGLLRSAVVVAAVLAGSGWFYYLNWQRYGDLTGGSVLYRLVDERPYAPGAAQGMWHYATRPDTIWSQLLQVGGLPHRFLSHPRELVVVLAAIILSALAVAAAVTLVRLVRRSWLLDGAGRWIVAGLLLILLAAYVELADHVAHKGGANNRYLLTGLVGWSIGVGLLLLAVRWRGIPLLAIVMIGCCALGSVAYTWRFTRRQPELHDLRWWDVLVGGMREVGVPAAPVVLVALLAVVGLGVVLQVASLVAIGRADSGAALAGDEPAHDESPAVGAVK